MPASAPMPEAPEQEQGFQGLTGCQGLPLMSTAEVHAWRQQIEGALNGALQRVDALEEQRGADRLNILRLQAQLLLSSEVASSSSSGSGPAPPRPAGPAPARPHGRGVSTYAGLRRRLQAAENAAAKRK